jgi:hypothetical protein
MPCATLIVSIILSGTVGGPVIARGRCCSCRVPVRPRSGRKDPTLNEDSVAIPKRLGALGGVSLAVALLQSLCTAVFAISGVRVLIGLGALAAVSGIYAPARGFHQDAIRIPMLIFATVGALVNLAVLGWISHLRRELTPKQKHSERLQVVLAIATLILVGLETWTHAKVHRAGPAPLVHSTSQ